MSDEQPIIIKRIKKGGHAHHGGSWKIAFADFATAMMAFFLVLWLTSSTTDVQKEAIAGYFHDPAGFTDASSPFLIDLGGKPMMIDSTDIAPTDGEDGDKLDADQVSDLAEKIEEDRLAGLLADLQTQVEENEILRQFKDQLLMEITPEGLRIQIVDDEDSPMFSSGSSSLKYYFEDILVELAPMMGSVPNRLSISGHTDATPYMTREGFGNWELSAARANSARRTLVEGGVDNAKVAQVIGFGDSVPFDRQNPTGPVNRRIDILIMSEKADKAARRIGDSHSDEHQETKAQPESENYPETEEGQTFPEFYSPPVEQKKQGSTSDGSDSQVKERVNIFDAKTRAEKNKISADEIF